MRERESESESDIYSSYIVAVSFMLVQETRVSGENRRPAAKSLTNLSKKCCIQHILPGRDSNSQRM